ncbi:MAG: YiaA/YiaB family inner membrane protein [Bacteroidota bacterium]
MQNYIYENHNTKAFYNMAWITFGIASIGMAVGLFYLDASVAMKGFLTMSYIFSVSSCFTVAKVVRDKHESDKFLEKVEKAKTEKFLAEKVI